MNLDLRNYSINFILDYLQQSGLFEVIGNVKNLLGDDIAIEVCKEFVKSNDCKTVVIIYMCKEPAPKNDDAYTHTNSLDFVFEFEDENKNENEKKNENENENNENENKNKIENENEEMGLIQLLNQDNNFRILNKFYTKRQILFKSLKILKRKGLL